MQKIGSLQSIWRYPVKGMAGEPVATCPVSERTGLLGDRIWAVQDVARQEVQSCKFRPNLLQCRARCVEAGDIQAPVELEFPGGERLLSDLDRASELVSELIAHSSRLVRLRPAEERAFYRRHKKDDHTWLEELKATFEREAGEPLPEILDNLPPAAQENVALLGTFFLVSPFHILTTASLAHMKALHPVSDWHTERFRPNVFIETLPEFHGLVEQDWLGKTLRIGDVSVACSEPAPRCGAVVRKQADFEEDKSILRSIVRDADQNLGIYGDVQGAGQLNVGDPVYLCD